MGAFSMAYSSEIFNKKSVTFTATLFTLLSHRLDISHIGCSPAEPIYVSTQYTNIKKQSDTVCFTLPYFLNAGRETQQKKRSSFLNPLILPL
jgi:hypothetical protein